MIQPLAAEMHYSIPSVRRFLAEAGYYSSFTHNGGCYENKIQLGLIDIRHLDHLLCHTLS
jgi:hypothetical protein